jgi:integrase
MPVVRITKTAVDAASPGDFLWDSQLKGFGCKVLPSGSRVYVAQYRTGGRGTATQRVTLGKHGALTPDQARKAAAAVLGRVAAGADPAAEKRARREAQKAPKTTVRAVAEEWLKRDQAENSSIYEVRRVMTRDVLPAIGDKPIGELRKRDIIEMLDGIMDRGSPQMANNVLTLVKRMLNWAAGRDIVDANVAQFIEPPAAKKSRDRMLSDAELLEVWRAADALGGTYGVGVKLLLLTGARRDEIFGLREDELDLDGAAIRLPALRSKNGVARTIPLSPQAVAILRNLPRLAGPYLLSVTGKHPRSNFGQCKRQLDERLPDLAPWVLHDLRRSVATGLQRLGSRLETIEVVLGHVSGSRRGVVGINQRHSFELEARQALEAWGRHIEGLLTGSPGTLSRSPPDAKSTLGRG